jgi:tape measure domain-containing protein
MAIKIELIIDEHGAVTSINKTSVALNGLDKDAKTAAAGISITERAMNRLGQAAIAYLSVQTAMSAGRFAKGFADTAGSFERMTVSLETLTKGHGTEKMEELANWAVKMPQTTEEAVRAFIILRAYGIEPTIAQMTILSDTVAAMGNIPGAFEGIARGLGQIQTKGKLQGQEIRQLSEWGINVAQILKEQLNTTANDIDIMGANAVDANTAIQALFRGMEKGYGGQSERMQKTYVGLISQMTDNWKLFQKAVMDTGPFEKVKAAIKAVNDEIRNMTQNIKDEQKLSMIGEKHPAGANLWQKILLPDWSLGISRLIPKGLSDKQKQDLDAAKEAWRKTFAPVKPWSAMFPIEVVPETKLSPESEAKIQDVRNEIQKMLAGALPNEYQQKRATIQLEYEVKLLKADTPELKAAIGEWRATAMKLLEKDLGSGAPGLGLTIKPRGSMMARAIAGLQSPEDVQADFDRRKEIMDDFYTAEEDRTTEHDLKLFSLHNDQRQKIIQLRYAELAGTRDAIQLGAEEQKEMAIANFEAQYGVYEKNNDLYIEAAKNLKLELALIDKNAANEAVDRQAQAWKNLADTISSTMQQAMQTSGNAMENIAAGFENMLESMAAQFAAKAAVFMLLNALSGGGFGRMKGIGSIGEFVFGNLFKASGGPVYGGKPYIVGERGPELFIPQSAGKIVPNNQVYNDTRYSVNLSVSGRSGDVTDRQFAERLIRVLRDHPRLKEAFARG